MILNLRSMLTWISLSEIVFVFVYSCLFLLILMTSFILIIDDKFHICMIYGMWINEWMKNLFIFYLYFVQINMRWILGLCSSAIVFCSSWMWCCIFGWWVPNILRQCVSLNFEGWNIEDEISTLFLNIRCQSPSDAAQFPSRMETIELSSDNDDEL